MTEERINKHNHRSKGKKRKTTRLCTRKGFLEILASEKKRITVKQQKKDLTWRVDIKKRERERAGRTQGLRRLTSFCLVFNTKKKGKEIQKCKEKKRSFRVFIYIS